jgi:hypothetical protein
MRHGKNERGSETPEQVIGRGGDLVDDHPFEQCFSAFLIEDVQRYLVASFFIGM